MFFSRNKELKISNKPVCGALLTWDINNTMAWGFSKTMMVDKGYYKTGKEPEASKQEMMIFKRCCIENQVSLNDLRAHVIHNAGWANNRPT